MNLTWRYVEEQICWFVLLLHEFFVKSTFETRNKLRIETVDDWCLPATCFSKPQYYPLSPVEALKKFRQQRKRILNSCNRVCLSFSSLVCLSFFFSSRFVFLFFCNTLLPMLLVLRNKRRKTNQITPQTNPREKLHLMLRNFPKFGPF